MNIFVPPIFLYLQYFCTFNFFASLIFPHTYFLCMLIFCACVHIFACACFFCVRVYIFACVYIFLRARVYFYVRVPIFACACIFLRARAYFRACVDIFYNKNIYFLIQTYPQINLYGRKPLPWKTHSLFLDSKLEMISKSSS